MAAATPAPPQGVPAGRPGHWFPLAVFGGLVALSVPLYAGTPAAPATGAWVAYAPLTRTVFWSSAHGNFSAAFGSAGGLLGIAGGWYWAMALAGGFGVTAAWYRRGRGAGGSRGYLISGLVLTAVVTVVPLLVMPQVSFPAWLWLDGEWAGGTFALLIIAVALWMLASRTRSRPLAFAALAYTAAALVVDWPALRAAPPALMPSGGDPLRTLAYLGSQPQPGDAVVLLPAGVLLVAAALSVALASRGGGSPQAR